MPHLEMKNSFARIVLEITFASVLILLFLTPVLNYVIFSVGATIATSDETLS
jgi:hypothetical protein